MPDQEQINALDTLMAAPAATPATPAMTPVPTTVPAPTQPEPASEIPEAVLRIPAMVALLSGTIPAISAPRGVKNPDPEVQTIVANQKPLLDAGFGFIATPTRSIIYNGLKIDPATIEAADKAGRLDDVAAPWEMLKQVALGTPKAPPADTVKPAALPTTAPAAPVPSTGANTELADAGAQNLSRKSPTDQPRPSAGAVANLLTRRPI